MLQDYFKVSRTVLEDVSMELTITKQMDVHNSVNMHIHYVAGIDSILKVGQDQITCTQT